MIDEIDRVYACTSPTARRATTSGFTSRIADGASFASSLLSSLSRNEFRFSAGKTERARRPFSRHVPGAGCRFRRDCLIVIAVNVEIPVAGVPAARDKMKMESNTRRAFRNFRALDHSIFRDAQPLI